MRHLCAYYYHLELGLVIFAVAPFCRHERIRSTNANNNSNGHVLGQLGTIITLKQVHTVDQLLDTGSATRNTDRLSTCDSRTSLLRT
jgi:hypothetical protein